MAWSKKARAVLCCLYSGAAFGIYWIPVRKLRDVGYNGAWSVFVFSVIPLLLVMPVIVRRWRIISRETPAFHICCVLAGMVFALYIGAYLYTDVVHVIALYYLLPIWGFIFARIFIGEPITGARWLAMILALAGLIALFSRKTGVPIPDRPGDWMALLAGVIWGGVALMLYVGKAAPIDYALGFVVCNAVASFAVAFTVAALGTVGYPEWPRIQSELIWLIPFSAVVIVPAAFATVYGPSQLNPGVSGLLFMTEISVTAISAAIFSGEPFGWRECAGVTLITIAGMMEPFKMLRDQSAHRRDAGRTAARVE
jgi:drug/metabolite transporter (DMT)-like permease